MANNLEKILSTKKTISPTRPSLLIYSSSETSDPELAKRNMEIQKLQKTIAKQRREAVSIREKIHKLEEAVDIDKVRNQVVDVLVENARLSEQV